MCLVIFSLSCCCVYLYSPTNTWLTCFRHVAMTQWFSSRPLSCPDTMPNALTPKKTLRCWCLMPSNEPAVFYHLLPFDFKTNTTKTRTRPPPKRFSPLSFLRHSPTALSITRALFFMPSNTKTSALTPKKTLRCWCLMPSNEPLLVSHAQERDRCWCLMPSNEPAVSTTSYPSTSKPTRQKRERANTKTILSLVLSSTQPTRSAYYSGPFLHALQHQN